MTRLLVLFLALLSFPLNLAALGLIWIAEILSRLTDAIIDMAEALNQLGRMSSKRASALLAHLKGVQ